MSCLFPIIDGMSLEMFGSKPYMSSTFASTPTEMNILSGVWQQTLPLINNLRYADDTTLMAEREEEIEPLDVSERGE